MVVQNGVGQIHNVVHPNPTQKSHNHWNIFKKLFQTQISQELFFFSVLHKNHHLFFWLHLDRPGLDPLKVLTKSRFRSSGVTEWCWTNSQCSPSKSHPKKSTIIETSSKNYLKPRFCKSCFFWVFYIKIIICFFGFTLTDRVWTHWKFLQKAGSGEVVLQNGVGQIHNVVHPNHAQKIPNDWNTFKNRFLSQVLEKFFLFLTFRSFESSGVRPQALTTHPNQQLKMQPNSFV